MKKKDSRVCCSGSIAALFHHDEGRWANWNGNGEKGLCVCVRERDRERQRERVFGSRRSRGTLVVGYKKNRKSSLP